MRHVSPSALSDVSPHALTPNALSLLHRRSGERTERGRQELSTLHDEVVGEREGCAREESREDRYNNDQSPHSALKSSNRGQISRSR